MEPTSKLSALPPELMVLLTSYLGGGELLLLYLCGSSSLQHLLGPRKGVQAFVLEWRNRWNLAWPNLVLKWPHLTHFGLRMRPINRIHLPTLHLEQLPTGLTRLELRFAFASEYLETYLQETDDAFPCLQELLIGALDGDVTDKRADRDWGEQEWTTPFPASLTLLHVNPLDCLLACQLPPNLTHLTCRLSIDATTTDNEPILLPQTLAYLAVHVLGLSQSQQFASQIYALPLTLFAFNYLGGDSCMSLNPARLSRTLKTISGRIAPWTTVDQWKCVPSSLTSLDFKKNRTRIDDMEQIFPLLPPGLTILSGLRSRLTSEAWAKGLPRSLTKLDTPTMETVDTEEVLRNLPPALKTLLLCLDHLTTDLGSLFPHLTDLGLESISLDDAPLLPCTLTKLSIFDCRLNDAFLCTLPPGLRDLSIQDGIIFEPFINSLPKTLVSLRLSPSMPISFEDETSPAHLPHTLEHLSLRAVFSCSASVWMSRLPTSLTSFELGSDEALPHDCFGSLQSLQLLFVRCGLKTGGFGPYFRHLPRSLTDLTMESTRETPTQPTQNQIEHLPKSIASFQVEMPSSRPCLEFLGIDQAE